MKMKIDIAREGSDKTGIIIYQPEFPKFKRKFWGKILWGKFKSLFKKCAKLKEVVLCRNCKLESDRECNECGDLLCEICDHSVTKDECSLCERCNF